MCVCVCILFWLGVFVFLQRVCLGKFLIVSFFFINIKSTKKKERLYFSFRLWVPVFLRGEALLSRWFSLKESLVLLSSWKEQFFRLSVGVFIWLEFSLSIGPHLEIRQHFGERIIRFVCDVCTCVGKCEPNRLHHNFLCLQVHSLGEREIYLFCANNERKIEKKNHFKSIYLKSVKSN